MPVKKLFNGIRIYIAIGTLLFTVEAAWWSLAVNGSSNLAVIRIQEIFAWLSLIFLVLAISIGPICKLFPKLKAKALLYDGRRLLGISTAWFAFLHAAITYIVLFKAPNPFDIGEDTGQAFLAGFVALLILLAMAFTSFDKAFRSMGKWWHRLQRLVYVAALAALLHTFMIGSHAINPLVITILSVAATLLVLMHVWLAFIRSTPTGWQVVTISYSIIFLLAIVNYGLGQYLGYNPIESLHGEHKSHDSHGN